MPGEWPWQAIAGRGRTHGTRDVALSRHAHDRDRPAQRADCVVRTARLSPYRPIQTVSLWRRALRHSASRGSALRIADQRFFRRHVVRETWVEVGTRSELLPGEFKVVWDGDTAIAVFNVDGDLYAVEDICTHDGGE